MRYRERTVPSTTLGASRVVRSRLNSNGSITTAEWNGFPSGVDIYTMSDMVNPGYYRAKREGALLPVAPMQSEKQEWLLEPGEVKFTNSSYTYQLSGCFASTLGIQKPPPWPLVDKDAILQAALARAQTDAWDTATFLAEFGKTIEMLTTLRGRWTLMYERCLRAANARRRRFKTFADAFANAWLELRYGFRPLYYDMLSIQETVRRMQEGIDSPLCRGWETVESSPATTSSIVNSSYWGCWLPNENGGLSEVYKVSIGGKSSPTVHLCTTSRTTVGRATVGVQVTTRELTMFDPAVTAWELLTFSFVLDWFITIGDAIAAFSPFATGSFRYATYSETKTEVKATHSQPFAAGTSSGGGTPSRLVRTTTLYSRSPSTVTPTLSFQVNLNAAKIVDLVALVWSMKLRHLKLLRL